MPGEGKLFKAKDTGYAKLAYKMTAPKCLYLKMEVKVMLLVNLSSTLVNGSIGTDWGGGVTIVLSTSPAMVTR